MFRIRPATDGDAAGVIDLVGSIYEEFEGCILDLDGIDSDLRRPESTLDRFWVLEAEGQILGTVACSLHDDHVELKKMYVDARFRGQGHGRHFVDLVEQAALQQGLRRVELWSDTRFVQAHGVYEHLGYVRSGKTRDLNDPSNTTEFHFTKTF